MLIPVTLTPKDLEGYPDVLLPGAIDETAQTAAPLAGRSSQASRPVAA